METLATALRKCVGYFTPKLSETGCHPGLAEPGVWPTLDPTSHATFHPGHCQVDPQVGTWWLAISLGGFLLFVGPWIRVPASDWSEVCFLASWIDLLRDVGPPILMLVQNALKCTFSFVWAWFFPHMQTRTPVNSDTPNSWKWLELNSYLQFGVCLIWKDAEVDGWIFYLRTVKNTLTLSPFARHRVKVWGLKWMPILECNLHTSYSKILLFFVKFWVATMLSWVIEEWNNANFRFLALPT
jgi:hypothetical protein